MYTPLIRRNMFHIRGEKSLNSLPEDDGVRPAEQREGFPSLAFILWNSSAAAERETDRWPMGRQAGRQAGRRGAGMARQKTNRRKKRRLEGRDGDADYVGV